MTATYPFWSCFGSPQLICSPCKYTGKTLLKVPRVTNIAITRIPQKNWSTFTWQVSYLCPKVICRLNAFPSIERSCFTSKGIKYKWFGTVGKVVQPFAILVKLAPTTVIVCPCYFFPVIINASIYSRGSHCNISRMPVVKPAYKSIARVYFINYIDPVGNCGLSGLL